jgi:hypothetical protein
MMGEELLSTHLEGYELHEDWSSPFDLENGAMIEAKLTRGGSTKINGNQRDLKVEAAKKANKPIQIMLWWAKDDAMELYIIEPKEDFYSFPSNHSFLADSKDGKLIGHYDAEGEWFDD